VARIAKVISAGRIHFDCCMVLIILRRLFFIFITVSVFLLVEFLFVVAANVAFANSLDYLLRQGTAKPSVAARAEGRCEGAAVSLAPTCAGISCCN
jgi:hypothetical protein